MDWFSFFLTITVSVLISLISVYFSHFLSNKREIRNKKEQTILTLIKISQAMKYEISICMAVPSTFNTVSEDIFLEKIRVEIKSSKKIYKLSEKFLRYLILYFPSSLNDLKDKFPKRLFDEIHILIDLHQELIRQKNNTEEIMIKIKKSEKIISQIEESYLKIPFDLRMLKTFQSY